MSEQEKDEIEKLEKKNERNFIVSILILILLIIIIFLLVKNLGFIDHRPRIPTGNVDIFDIIFKNDCNNNCCNCNCNTNCPDCNEDEPGFKPEDNDNPLDTGIDVFDKETEYGNNTKLNIFSKTSYYVVDGKIAPGSENAYQFVIRNNNDFNIKYSLELTETNKFNINMKYRLKLNDKYIVGDENNWVSYEELDQYNLALASNTYDIYTLDWKWFEGSNDTEVGMNIDSEYRLDIKILASSY